MAKLYDIVETSKMSAEYDGSLIFNTYRATNALENGRLIAFDVATGKARYAVSGDAKVYLHTSVEVMADTIFGLTKFRKEADEFVRGFGMRSGDEFSTTAFVAGAVKGDKVVLGADGKLEKSATPSGSENFIAEVLEVTSLGYDRIPAINVRVIKA
jgi:hypothetical protein